MPSDKHQENQPAVYHRLLSPDLSDIASTSIAMNREVNPTN